MLDMPKICNVPGFAESQDLMLATSSYNWSQNRCKMAGTSIGITLQPSIQRNSGHCSYTDMSAGFSQSVLVRFLACHLFGRAHGNSVGRQFNAYNLEKAASASNQTMSRRQDAWYLGSDATEENDRVDF